MSNVLVAVPENQEATQLEQLECALANDGYWVLVRRGCTPTIEAAAASLEGALDAVLLDSMLVAASLRQTRLGELKADIITELRRELGEMTLLLVYMTKPFCELSKDLQDAIWKSDALIDMPTNPSEIVSRLNFLLTCPRHRIPIPR